MYTRKRVSFALIASLLLMAAAPAFATNTPNPCGNSGNNCNPEGGSATQQQDQNQHQSNQQDQGQGQAQNATGTGTGIAVAGGGDAFAAGGTGFGGAGGQGGTALSGSQSGAVSGSQSGVQGSGNADVRTTIGPVGSTSGALSGSLSGANATNGDQTQRTNVENGSTSLSGSNSGGNELSNGSASLSGASNGDQSLNGEQTTTVGNTTEVNTGGAQSDAEATVGDTAASSDNAVSTNVNASNNSRYNSQSLGLPSIFTAAPAIVGVGGIVTDRSTCGPRVQKKTTTVQGVFFGLFKRGYVDLGPDDEIVDADEPYEYYEDTKRGITHIFGHQLLTVIAKDSVAGSRALGANGGQTGGDYGGLGLSSNTSMTRTTIRVQVRRCELTPVAPTVPVIEFKESRAPRG